MKRVHPSGSSKDCGRKCPKTDPNLYDHSHDRATMHHHSKSRDCLPPSDLRHTLSSTQLGSCLVRSEWIDARQIDHRKRTIDHVEHSSCLSSTKRNCRISPNHLNVCSETDLDCLAKLSDVKVVRSAEVNQGIEKFLQCHEKRSIDRISLVVKILAIVCKSALQEKDKKLHDDAKALLRRMNILDDSCFTFWGEISSCIRLAPHHSLQYIQKYEFMASIQTIMSIIFIATHLFSANINQIIPFLPVDEFHGALKQLCDESSKYKKLYEQSLQLLFKRDKLRESCHMIPDDSCQFVVLPKREDLLCKSIPEDLRKNKAVFSCNKEYLEIHLDLLRQDFIHPLRCVLYNLREQFDHESEDYVEDSRHDIHVSVYENVRFLEKDVCGEDVVYKVKFALPKDQKVNWNYSKRFIFGSIVCISEDNFDTFFYATVANRDANELKKGIITLKILEISQQHFIMAVNFMTSKKRYRMIESPAYFEAYSSIVNQINAMKKEPHNLSSLVETYMVKGETNFMQLPLYLQTRSSESEGCLIDLTGILCTCKERECTHGSESVDVTQKFVVSDFQSPLDESQIDALHLAMSSELSLIQGPPGTGKTFVGARFMEALVKNRFIWNPEGNVPILVLCQTNHALDQFLEEVLDSHITTNIVRIGGRSKSEKVRDMKLNLKDKKYFLKAEQRRTRSANFIDTAFRKESLVAAETQIEALEELCFGVPYNELNEKLYCSLLSPRELSNPEYKPLCFFLKKINDSRRTLQWFGIETKENEDQNHPEQRTKTVFNDADAIEDDRRIEDDTVEALFEGSRIFNFAKDRKDLKNFFQKLKRAESNDYRGCSLHNLRKDQKLDLLKFCMRHRYESLKKIIKDLKQRKGKFEEEDEAITLSLLRRADVVGITTTGASIKTKILQKLRCRIIIVEEAAEVMEAHILAALSKHTQQLVLIGDHKQLRPKANDFEIGKHYGLEVSLFERLINNGVPSIQLKYQHRMRPEIAELVRPHIYKELYDHDKVKAYEPIRGMKNSLFFVDHNFPERCIEGLVSPANDHEASFIMHLTDYLLHQGYQPDQITVLTPYSGQVTCLKEQMDAHNMQPIRIIPVDNYQGEENDIILLSLVRSVRAGFVKEENRICVALSRARKGLYVIGNFSRLFTRSAKIWLSIVEDLKKVEHFGTSLPLQCSLHGNITEVININDFIPVKDGGCTQPCGHRFQCGHVCPRKCHPDDRDHQAPCQKPCVRKCSKGLHQCTSTCSTIPCPPCKELVLETLSKCKHEQFVPCYMKRSHFVCQEECKKKLLKCGHKCQRKCGEMCTIECGELVMKTLPCGHKAQTECYKSPEDKMKSCQVPCNTELSCGHTCQGTCGRCHQGRLHIPCNRKCTRVLLCGHPCSSDTCAINCPPCKKMCVAKCSHEFCGHACELPCILCAEPCEWNCPHYQCSKMCGEFCDRPRCNEPCLLQLECGHYCLGLCGEPCPFLCKECDPHNEAFDVFFGDEDGPGSRFISLECKHIFEVSGLDHYMDMKPDEDQTVQWKGCPRCNTPIMCARYSNVIKQIKIDMSLVKKKESIKLSNEERDSIKREVETWNEQITNDYLRSNGENLSDIHLQSLHTRQCAAIECEKLLKFFTPKSEQVNRRNVLMQIKKFTFSSSNTERDDQTQIINQVKTLRDYVSSLPVRKVSACLPQQVSNDIHCERRRLCLLMKFYELSDAIKSSHVKVNELDYEQCIAELNPPNYKPVITIDTEELYKDFCEKISEISEKYNLGQLTEEEKRTIVAAIGGKKGSWFKCPNGHYYNIGQCGGAMQRGKCIECKAEVGGSNHHLLESNTHAGEMDQSKHAAWSEQANMDNYEFL